MDFKDSIRQIADRIEKIKHDLPTEEATKTALILPFIQALGYDIFAPSEVRPEMPCDIGTKKGEKIDYAILKDGEPVILIECKHWAQDLNSHDAQLLRYFTVSKAKFGVLTNGITYRFYTDLDEKNLMDKKPFLEVNLLDLKDAQIEELKKFHKSYFDIPTILSSASELKYMGELKTLISGEISSPSPDFVKHFGKQIYTGRFTPDTINQFAMLVKRAFASYINDLISDRLKAVIEKEEEGEQPQTEQTQVESVASNEKREIVTTEEELEAFYIVKSILRPYIPHERITYRDALSYFSVFVDDNNRKPVCRFYFNSEVNKQIGLFGGKEKEPVRCKINSLDDIYNYTEELIGTASQYLG